jgi:hypothetical protein
MAEERSLDAALSLLAASPSPESEFSDATTASPDPYATHTDTTLSVQQRQQQRQRRSTDTESLRENSQTTPVPVAVPVSMSAAVNHTQSTSSNRSWSRRARYPVSLSVGPAEFDEPNEPQLSSDAKYVISDSTDVKRETRRTRRSDTTAKWKEQLEQAEKQRSLFAIMLPIVELCDQRYHTRPSSTIGHIPMQIRPNASRTASTRRMQEFSASLSSELETGALVSNNRERHSHSSEDDNEPTQQHESVDVPHRSISSARSRSKPYARSGARQSCSLACELAAFLCFVVVLGFTLHLGNANLNSNDGACGTDILLAPACCTVTSSCSDIIAQPLADGDHSDSASTCLVQHAKRDITAAFGLVATVLFFILCMVVLVYIQVLVIYSGGRTALAIQHWRNGTSAAVSQDNTGEQRVILPLRVWRLIGRIITSSIVYVWVACAFFMCINGLMNHLTAEKTLHEDLCFRTIPASESVSHQALREECATQFETSTNRYSCNKQYLFAFSLVMLVMGSISVVMWHYLRWKRVRWQARDGWIAMQSDGSEVEHHTAAAAGSVHS